MLTKPTVVIISQHTHTSSHYAVHFNTMSCVNLISTSRQRNPTSKTKQNKKTKNPTHQYC